MMPRKMALTPELVAQAHRVVDEPGPDAEFVPYTDEEYRAAVATILAGHPPGQDAWLFAYGSLIWRPAVKHVEERIGTARGWHRSFAIKLTRWRGTKEQLMGLDRGGSARVFCIGYRARVWKRNWMSSFAARCRVGERRNRLRASPAGSE